MIHVLRAPSTTTADERKQLDGLDKYQRRYLKKFCCGLCDHSMAQVGCGSFYESCDESARIDRRDRCLSEYKPREQQRNNHD